MQFVKTKEGREVPIADNESPYNLNCPIDGTQLAETREQDFNGYSCVTCNSAYSVRRGGILQFELERQARTHLKDAREEIKKMEDKKSELLKLLGLASNNNFS